MKQLIGRKVGQTRVYDDAGHQVPVTVLEVGPCPVVQRKTKETDGYDAIQLGFLPQKEQRLTKPVAGHFKKAGVAPCRILSETRLADGEDAKVGDILTAGVFEGVKYVDVLARTKGKGFQGVVRRHGMSGGPAAHGSGTHRRPGSIGNREWPARIFKNKRLPGQMGAVNVTTQNLRVVRVMADSNVLLVEGAVPGPVDGIVLVRKAIKKA